MGTRLLLIARWWGAQPGIWSRLTWPGVATRWASRTWLARSWRARRIARARPRWSPAARRARRRFSSVIAGAGPLLAAAGALIGQVRGYGRGAWAWHCADPGHPPSALSFLRTSACPMVTSDHVAGRPETSL